MPSRVPYSWYYIIVSNLEAPIYRLFQGSLISILCFSALSIELEQTSEFETHQFKCIEQIISHPITKRNYPNLIQDQNKQLYFSFLNEIDKFCACQSKHIKIDLNERERDFFKWSFKDKKLKFEKEDQCMVENFSEHAIHTFYTISLDTRFRKYLSLRIKHRLPSSSNFLADETSKLEKFSCLEEQILQKCSKVKSLRSTYKCIEAITNGHEKFNEVERRCPDFQQDYRMAETKQLI